MIDLEIFRKLYYDTENFVVENVKRFASIFSRKNFVKSNSFAEKKIMYDR